MLLNTHPQQIINMRLFIYLPNHDNENITQNRLSENQNICTKPKNIFILKK